MPNTPIAIRSLESPCNSHAVFEPDQVLNHNQLNSIADYLGDQERLTRVRLIGAGIIEGLEVRIDGTGVTVSKGLGITTDGDLVVQEDEKPFVYARPYLPATPAPPDYPPFTTPAPLTAHELLTEEAPQSVRIADLPGGLADRAVIAYVESRISDSDMCTGVDCDNHGQDLIHTLRFLLVTPIGGLAAAPTTVADEARALPRLDVRRPALGAGTLSAGALAAAFASAVDATRPEFDAAMDQFDGKLGAFSAGAGSPGADAKLRSLWDAAMSGTVTAANTNSANHLGPALVRLRFLRDVADAWNELRDALLGLETVVQSGNPANTKHLVLAGPAASRLTSRSRFVPAPSGRGTRLRQRAEFLFHRLASLLKSFRIPAAGGSLVITPSRGERAPLGDRAMPSHFAPVAGLSPADWWSPQATLDGGPPVVGSALADSPLTKSAAWALARFRSANDFFAIDGVRGQNAAAVVTELKKKIADHNLPFTVIAVSLGTKSEDVLLKPPIRYGDLHRLHKLIRSQLANQVRRTDDFLKAFVTKVDASKSEGIIELDSNSKAKLVDNRQKVETASTTATASVTTKATFAAARADTTLRDSISIVRDQSLASVSLLDDHLGGLQITPADPFAVRIFDDWPRWLEQLSDQREQALNDRLLFSKFVADHPGLEHLGGVERGGTLVLVYGTGGSILADLSLPYRVVDEAEPDPASPTLTAEPTEVNPPLLGGIVLRPSRDRWFEEKEIKIRRDLTDTWEFKLDDRLGSMKKSNDLLLGSIQGAFQQFVFTPPKVTQPPNILMPTELVLTAPYTEFTNSRDEATNTRHALVKDDISDAERTKLAKQLAQKEKQAAEASATMVNAVVDGNISVAAGSDGDRVLRDIAVTGMTFTNQESRKKLIENLEAAAGRTTNSATKTKLVGIANAMKGA
jgi:hypothetical protein